LLKILKKIRAAVERRIVNKAQMSDKALILLATNPVQSARRNKHIEQFGDVEFSVFSQWGEDGVIDWLITMLPFIPQTFIEFGVENYREANTRFLLQSRNWKGLVLDGSKDNISDIRSQDVCWRHELDAKQAFITRENINSLLEESGFKGELGLLSVDIDGNDYWVWKALEVVRPAIVVVEYNAVLGDVHSLVIPYRADFIRRMAHHSNLYFGASLPALVSLSREKGYTFVGSTTSGVNAFFVRDDFVKHITDHQANCFGYPSRVREARNSGGELAFVGGVDRATVIADLPLLDIATGMETSLGRLEKIYSDCWTNGLGRAF
jgi:hypothetical protein